MSDHVKTKHSISKRSHSSSSVGERKSGKSSSKSKKKRRSYRRSSSSDSDSDTDSSSSFSSSHERRRKRHRSSDSARKKKKHHTREKKRHKEKKHKKHKKKKESDADRLSDAQLGPTLPMNPVQESPPTRVLKPMTKEEWEKQQSVVRRVYDPETGRNRLIKGDGEVLEEIVSRKQHQEINKKATMGDGLFYQSQMGTLKPS